MNTIPKTENAVETIASVFSVIRNASVPYGITTPDEPNISSTRWRTVADQKRKLYFLESALTPNVFWVDLTRLDFSENTRKVMRLDLGANQTHIYSGLANDQVIMGEIRWIGKSTLASIGRSSYDEKGDLTGERFDDKFLPISIQGSSIFL